MTDLQSTHGHDCWSWGPKHYECAVAEIGRLREELSKMRGAEPSDEEINATIGKHFQLPGNACRAHAAIAEVLRARPAASAEPSDEEIRSEQVRRMAEDAARYRWLRDPCSGAERVIFYCRGDYGRGLMSSATLDAAIDEAMKKEESINESAISSNS